MTPESIAADVVQIGQATVSRIASAASQEKGKVARLSARTYELRILLKDFRGRNGLQRPAHYPDDRSIHYAILLLMVALESGFNGVVFAQGNDQGLVGGFLQALIFSLANVTFGAASGRLIFPNVLHRSTLRRVIGVVGSLTYLVLAVAFSLAVAHFRDSSQTGDSEAAALAMAHLRAAPFSLRDLNSWLLFSMGIGFSLGAAIDGLKLDDPYPGFGPIDRKYSRELARQVQVETRFRQSLGELRDAAGKQMAVLVDRARLGSSHRLALRDRLDRTVQDYQRHCQAVGDVLRVLVDEYRDANRVARTTPAPNFFETAPLYLPPPLHLQTASDAEIDLTRKVSSAMTQITSAHDQALEDVFGARDVAEEPLS